MHSLDYNRVKKDIANKGFVIVNPFGHVYKPNAIDEVLEARLRREEIFCLFPDYVELSNGVRFLTIRVMFHHDKYLRFNLNAGKMTIRFWCNPFRFEIAPSPSDDADMFAFYDEMYVNGGNYLFISGTEVSLTYSIIDSEAWDLASETVTFGPLTGYRHMVVKPQSNLRNRD
jgi:hypothetical protein